MRVLDEYVMKSPSPQNVLDIFDGEWSSKLPDSLGLRTRPGTSALFEDDRVTWAEQNLGAFRGRRILELGPLEGGHSYMLQKAGACEVMAIEANTRAFLKCLCIKDVLGLDRVEFRLGDFMSYLREDIAPHDVVFASGVLYHMQDPVALLEQLAAAADQAFIWTHYYDADVVRGRADLRRKLGPLRSVEHDGFHYECSTQSYRRALRWAGFCGGPQPVSTWLTRDGIMEALARFGFTQIVTGFEQPDHPNGPALAICASKPRHQEGREQD